MDVKILLIFSTTYILTCYAYTCPEVCRCQLVNVTTLHTDCSGLGLKELPEGISEKVSMEATSL